MNKIKYIIFGIFIAVIMLFITSFILSSVHRNTEICIKDINNFDNNINELSAKVDKVKDDTCRVALNYMLDRIKVNHLTGCVKQKEYLDSFYYEDLSFVDVYSYVASACDIDSNSIYIRAMSTLVYPNYIKDRYNRSYEIHFKDGFFHDEGIDEVGSYTTLANEMIVLSDILEELK